MPCSIDEKGLLPPLALKRLTFLDLSDDYRRKRAYDMLQDLAQRIGKVSRLHFISQEDLLTPLCQLLCFGFLACMAVGLLGQCLMFCVENREFRAILAALWGTASGQDLSILFDGGWIRPPSRTEMLRGILREGIRRVRFEWNARVEM